MPVKIAYKFIIDFFLGINQPQWRQLRQQCCSVKLTTKGTHRALGKKHKPTFASCPLFSQSVGYAQGK